MQWLSATAHAACAALTRPSRFMLEAIA